MTTLNLQCLEIQRHPWLIIQVFIFANQLWKFIQTQSPHQIIPQEPGRSGFLHKQRFTGVRPFHEVSGCTERRKQQWRVRSYQHLVTRVQPKLPQITQMVLLNLLTHLVKLSLIQVQKEKGKVFLRFEKYDFIRLTTQHLLQQQESGEFIGGASPKPIRCLLCVARTWLYNATNATVLHKAGL